MSESANIRVLARFRPINGRERKEYVEAGKDPETMICKFLDEATVEIELEGGLGTKKYNFDRVYPPGTPQRDVYNLAANDTVKQILQGYNGTILSYGETGSGKSFSMFGPDVNDEEMKGIIPRAADHIFNHIMHCDEDIEFEIKCSFLEIYNESVNDLLARGEEHENLKIRESPDRGIYVENAVETVVGTPEDIITVINIGDSNRAVSATSMNPVSSRSHTIIMITVSQVNENDKSKKDGKLCLVDLAGSEKIGKTGVVGDRLKEAQNINSSLTALGMCIKALADQSDGKSSGHIPYRDSKLTRILQESLGGNSKTSLLIALSPHPFNLDETISTLEFGKRAKQIKNKVKVNATKSVKELMAIIDKLQIQIAGQDKFIQLQRAVIQAYADKYGPLDGVYVPTEEDLTRLKQGKKIKAEGGGEGDENDDGVTPTEGELDRTLAGGSLDDASIRIASLTSQLEKEQEAKFLMKQNYEADIEDLERKLKEAIANGGAATEHDDFSESLATSDNGQSIKLKELEQEIASLKKQILIYQGVDVSTLSSNTVDLKDVKIDMTVKPVDNKRVEELEKQLEDEKIKVQELEDDLDAADDDYDELEKELNDKINVLKQENNRLRGVEAEEVDTAPCKDERDRIIKQMDGENTKLKRVIASLKNECQKAKLATQRAELANERYIKAKEELIALQQKTDSAAQETEKDVSKELHLAQTEIALLQEKYSSENERVTYLYTQIQDQTSALQKMKNEKQMAIKEKDEEIRKIKSDFEAQKTKMQENLVERNKVYRPIQNVSVAQQLAQQNPDILERLKNMKSSWLTKEED